MLWAALLSLEDLELPGVNLEFVIYSGDADISPEQTFQHVKVTTGVQRSQTKHTLTHTHNNALATGSVWY